MDIPKLYAFILIMLAAMPVMDQNEDAVKLIQFEFLLGDIEYNKPMEAPIDKKRMEFENPFDGGKPLKMTDTSMVKKPKGYIRLCPYSIWNKRGEDPIYDVTMEDRPTKLIMNEESNFSKKLQTDYGHTLKPSIGRICDMLNNSTSIEVGQIFKKYIKPIFKKDKKLAIDICIR